MNTRIASSIVVTCLLAVVFLAPAHARNNNGVYVDVDHNLDRNDLWARVEVSYACHGHGEWARIQGTSALAYCKSGADIQVAWHDDRSGLSNPPALEHFSVDDSSSGHCGPGEAVTWRVSGLYEPGSSSIGSEMELLDACQRCDYTGGPCE